MQEKNTFDAFGPVSSLNSVRFMGISPQDSGMLRVKQAQVSLELSTAPEQFFNAFSRWAGYEYWAPDVQGTGHWLVVKEGGSGSRFILYDKPGQRHLAHYGVVTELERERRFAWRAPFSEWNRAFIGTVLEVAPTSTGGSRVTETMYFDAREDHLPVLADFMALSGLDPATMTAFLEARLRGLDHLIQSGKLSEGDLSYLYVENQVVAADWANRISTGEWVRILYADGEIDFPASPDVVFNTLTRWARYADWTRTIHVGAEWHVIRQGGLGSRFLLWEKPGDRHVMHYGTMTEFKRNQRFAWRAPFSEWNKVWIGTDMQLIRQVVATLKPYERSQLARRLAEIELQMFITDAFFHADLHPGNIFFTTDGRILILDVGMVGRMSPELQDRFLCYWIAITRQQRERAFYHLLKMALSTEDADLEQFRLRYERILDAFYGAPLSERSLAQTYLEILLAGAELNVIFPSEMMLQAKAVVTTEALDLVLDPNFQFTEEARPIVARAVAGRASPRRLLDRMWSMLAEFILLGEIPPAGSVTTGERLDERRFRQEVVQALAYVWAEDMDEKLRQKQADVDRYASAAYWLDHPELQAMWQTALGVLHLFTMQLDRSLWASEPEREQPCL